MRHSEVLAEHHRYKVRIMGSVLSALLAAPFGMFAAPAEAQSLKQSVETVIKTHPKAQAIDAQWRAAVQDVAQARAGYLPTIDMNLADGKEHTDTPQVRTSGAGALTLVRREAGLVVSQKLFDGKATTSEVERLTARVDAAAHRRAETHEDLALRTTEAYTEVLKNRELLRLANENLKAHLQTMEKVRLRVQGGVGQRADLQQAAGRVALARSVATARAGKLRESEVAYQTLVGAPAGDLSDPQITAPSFLQSGTLDADRLAQAIRKASEGAATSNPTLNAANAEIVAADATVRSARSGYFPRLNLEASVNRNQNISGIPGTFNNEALMLVLRWNLFRGGGDRAQERASAERRFAAVDSAASTRRDVEERVATALHAKATSEERLAYLREHVTLSADVLESYKQQLDLGRRTLLDVLNAENELFTAQSNLVAGRYEDLLNHFAIEAAQGTLVRTIGVAPQN